jgi:hypothetical protein
MTAWLQRLLCVLRGGHYPLLHKEPGRLALRCAACGHQTTGWVIGT